MRKFFVIFAVLVAFFSLVAQDSNDMYQQYLNQYKKEQPAQAEQAKPAETAPAQTEAPAPAAAPSTASSSFTGHTGNSNDKILAMAEQGLDTVQIAKTLGLGVGEVKLVLDLFK